MTRTMDVRRTTRRMQMGRGKPMGMARMGRQKTTRKRIMQPIDSG
jgi:hypothetical protein